MVIKLKEGYQDESFVAYYNGELFYTGQLDSNFGSAIQKLIRRDESAYKSVCDYLESSGVEDFDYEDDFNISYLLSQLMYYESTDGEDYWNFDGFEIFPEYELDESIRKARSRIELSENISRKISPQLVSMKNLSRAINRLLSNESDRAYLSASFGISDINTEYYMDIDDYDGFIDVNITYEDGDAIDLYIYNDMSGKATGKPLYRMVSNADDVDTGQGVQLVTIKDIFKYANII